MSKTRFCMIFLLLYGLSLFRTVTVTGAGHDNGYGHHKLAIRAEKNVRHLRAELPTLRWMGDRAHAPKSNDQTMLEDGARLGCFWSRCKYRKKCMKPPYDRLLTNPVLRADYRCSVSVTRGPWIRGLGRMWITYGPSCPP